MPVLASAGQAWIHFVEACALKGLLYPSLFISLFACSTQRMGCREHRADAYISVEAACISELYRAGNV
jgi:hypothetical protein